MKALFINGGPRKNWSTYQMLEKAMEGARDEMCEVELINLYDYDFKGCKSCFACKVKNPKTDGVCIIKDDLTPILKKAIESDIIVMASPIYFYYTTGVLKSFMERLMYPNLSYYPKIDEKTGEVKSSLLGRTIPTAMIYRTGVPEKDVGEFKHILDGNEYFLKSIFGYTETLYSYFTYQFKDYSRYDLVEGLENLRLKQKEEQFPKDLKKAYELGVRLAKKAKNL